MPAEPIEYRIVRDLQTALLAIAVADGYHYDVARVAVKLDPNQDVEALIAPDGPRPFIVLEVKPERWEYFPGEVRLVLPWTIHWVNDAEPTVDEARLQMFFRGCADVEQAIVAEPYGSGRSGLATDTRIVKRELNPDPDGAQVWAMVDIEIRVYREYGRPNG